MKRRAAPANCTQPEQPGLFGWPAQGGTGEPDPEHVARCRALAERVREQAASLRERLRPVPKARGRS